MFQQFSVFNFKGKPIAFDTPRVMGILNVTPDSFHDGGTLKNVQSAVRRAGKMLKEGACFIDIGGQSTRPGAKMVSVKTEMSRVVPVINAIMNRYPEALISIDTFQSEIADAAVEAGAVMVNDVSGGNLDKNMFKTVGRLQVPYVLMHMKGTPATMQKNPVYKDVTDTVFGFFIEKMVKLEKCGVKDILVDPGFGFGKTPEHNFSLLKNLPLFLKTGRPVLVGLSRKSMICRTLGIPPARALNGTTALNMAALMGGASVLRVHDVKEAAETVMLFEKLNS